MIHLFSISSLFYFSAPPPATSPVSPQALRGLSLTTLAVAHFIDFEIYYGNKAIP